MVNVASRWSPADYAKNAAFVPALGDAVLQLLAPQPGELILDVGCGDGALTQRIAAAGARVIGLDSSPEMVEAARARGIDAFVADAESMDLSRFGKFDAVFSNAALHWMLDPEAVATGIFDALRDGGRFVGEMGGEGNLAKLREALDAELVARGYPPPLESSNWYPSVEEFADVYEKAGFIEVDARLIERPTPMPNGIGQWVTTFRRGWLDRAGVPEGERADIGEAVAESVGSPQPDYVRLRFIMRKPN